MATMTETRASVSLATHHSSVGNRETEGRGGVRPVVSPATGESFAQVSLLDAAHAGAAVQAARNVPPTPAALSFLQPGRFLPKLPEALRGGAARLAAPIA